MRKLFLFLLILSAPMLWAQGVITNAQILQWQPQTSVGVPPYGTVYEYLNSSTGQINCINYLGASVCGSGSGTGTVTHTAGALTANAMLAGNGGADIKVADGNGVLEAIGALTTDIQPLKITWTYNNGSTTFNGIEEVTTVTATSGSTNYLHQWFCGSAGTTQCLTLDTAGNLVASGTVTAAQLTAAGTGAGAVALTQGAAPSLPANSAGFSAPTSIGTAYSLVLPSAGPSGTSLLEFAAVSGGFSAGSFVAPSSLSGISGLTSGYIPLAGSPTTLTSNSPCNYAVTTAGTATCTSPWTLGVSGQAAVTPLVGYGSTQSSNLQPWYIGGISESGSVAGYLYPSTTFAGSWGIGSSAPSTDVAAGAVLYAGGGVNAVFTTGAASTAGLLECFSGTNTVTDCASNAKNFLGVTEATGNGLTRLKSYGMVTVNIVSGTTVAGDYMCSGTLVAATQNIVDNGSTQCSAGQQVGFATQTQASPATTVKVLLTSAQGVTGSGGSGAPGGVQSPTKKTATYAGASGDFSSSTAAPGLIIFTLTAVGQSYTLLSSAPATGSCVMVENSLASAPFILGLITGGSTTLDGTAYTTALTSPQLGPGQKAEYCSDGTNYYTAQSTNGDVFNFASNKGGYFAPYFSGTTASGVSTSANTPQCTIFDLPKMQLVTNITYVYNVGVAASTGDWGIYDLGGNLLTHTGSQATTVVGGGQAKVAAVPAITLPKGTYSACACASSTTVSFTGLGENGINNGVFNSTSAALVPGQTALGSASSCTAGVLPSTTTFTNSTAPNVLPGMVLTP